MNFLSLKEDAFGLDISDLSLKIARLKEKKGSLRLASFGDFEVKPGLIERGEIKDQEAVITVLKKALSQVQGESLDTKWVVACLPEEKAFLDVIQLPLLPEEELAGAIHYQAENYIPLASEESYLDFQLIQPSYNHLDHCDVLVAAFPKEIIDSYIQILKKVSLKPRALETESLAIARALLKKGTSSAPILIVDLGAAKTNFLIFSGNCLRFSSSITLSGQNFTEIIAKRMGISLLEAEEVKKEYTTDKADFSSKDDQDQKKKTTDIFEVLAPGFSQLAREIQRCLDYYQTHITHQHLPPGKLEIEKILLSGGGAGLGGLDLFLAKELRLRVEIANPWINVFGPQPKEIPAISFKESLKYTTALGLSLRSWEENRMASFP